jgi:hypothetical protein
VRTLSRAAQRPDREGRVAAALTRVYHERRRVMAVIARAGMAAELAYARYRAMRVNTNELLRLAFQPPVTLGDSGERL